MCDTARYTMSCSHQARRHGNVVSPSSSSRCGSQWLSASALRSAVMLLVLLASSLVQSAAVDHRPKFSAERRPLGPQHYAYQHHHRKHVDAAATKLEAWQVARCRQRDHYVACFLCGKIVQSREVYYGCCRMDDVVLTFCDQLLA